MGTTHRRILPIYVYEAPVRIWHWVMAVAMVVLGVTGYFIGSPLPPSAARPATTSCSATSASRTSPPAYVFAVGFLMRVLWAFFGNRYLARDLPGAAEDVHAVWWSGFIKQTLHYLFLRVKCSPGIGHNPLAMAAMFFMFVLGTVFMICTGFALYGEGLGMNSWAFKMFSSWVLPLLGNSQNVHTLHHLGMWYL